MPVAIPYGYAQRAIRESPLRSVRICGASRMSRPTIKTPHRCETITIWLYKITGGHWPSRLVYLLLSFPQEHGCQLWLIKKIHKPLAFD